MSFLEIHSLGKSYRRTSIINELSFTVERGEFLVIFGPSGSGKTVLLRLIAGMVPPDSGRIVIGGLAGRHAKLGTHRGRHRQGRGGDDGRHLAVAEAMARGAPFGAARCNSSHVVAFARRMR